MKNTWLFASIIYSTLTCISPSNSLAQPQPAQPNRPVVLSSANNAADCVYLTTDHQNRPVACWTEIVPSTKEKRMYYAVSNDGGNSFTKPSLVPTLPELSIHSEGMPKVAFKADGTLVAVYQVSRPTKQNEYAGALLYTQSFDKGATWTQPRPVHSDTNANLSRSFFDITRLQNGEIACTWLDSDRSATPSHTHGAVHHSSSHQANEHRHKGGGRPLYFAKTEGKNGFGKDIQIAKPTCECCRTDLLTDERGNLHVAFRALYPDGSRDMAYCSSSDNGQTFSAPIRISPDQWQINACPHTGPSIAVNGQATTVAWYTGKEGEAGIYYATSTNGGKTFTMRQSIQPFGMAKHPQIASLGDGTYLAVWDESIKSGEAFHSRIGMKKIADSQPPTSSIFLTPDGVNAFHPSLLVVDNKSVLIAWTQVEGNQQLVYCQRKDK